MESKHGLSALNLPLKPGVSTELRPPPADSRGTAAGPGASEGADKPSAVPPDGPGASDAAQAPSAVAADHQPLDEAAPTPQPTTTRTIKRVGVLLVHGIGEQRRFEHLEGQTKRIAEAIIQREERTGQKTQATFEISPPPVGGAPYQSEQDSWASGRFPPVRALVRHGAHLEHETHLHFHEVWWADVNESSTLSKQIRFWTWGLGMWLTPGKDKDNVIVAGLDGMALPKFPGSSSLPRVRRLSLWNRAQLFLAAWVFFLSSFSITLAVFVLKRLNFGVWSPVRTFVNYLSGVKLYTQNYRSGGGPLDGIHEPPRFAIRRRMVRAIVDVACAKYECWYIMAHSLGSVVAFNGLMTHAHSLPNYLDERRWKRLSRKAGWVGQPRDVHETITISKERPEIPPRPLWIGDEKIVVYREALFATLRGFLTYGSPLDKFAGMWPAYVPINLDTKVFQNTTWINISDRTDPVAAFLKAYDAGILKPTNYGYCALKRLLLSHLKYLDLSNRRRKRGKQPADYIVNWLLEDRFEAPRFQHENWYRRQFGKDAWYQRPSIIAKARVALAYFQWVLIAALLGYFGCWALRWIMHLFNGSIPFADQYPWLKLHWFRFLDWQTACAGTGACNSAFAALCQLRPSPCDIFGLGFRFDIFGYHIGCDSFGFWFWCVVGALLIGAGDYLINRVFFRKYDDPQEWAPQPQAQSPQPGGS